MQNQLATKADVFEIKTEMATKNNLRTVEISLIKWIIAVNTATVGLLFTTFKLLG